METKHKKILIIAASVFFGSYMVRGVGNFFAYRAYVKQQEAIAAQQKAAAEARKKAAEEKAALKAKADEAKRKAAEEARASLPPPPPEPDPVFLHIRGRWMGRAAIEGKGICTLRFELDNKLREQNDYSGFFNLGCELDQALTRASGRANVLKSRMDPEAATLKGSPENGSLKLLVDKVVGKSIQGCAVSSATVTPFGLNQIDVSWTEEGCAGGHIILRRMGA